MTEPDVTCRHPVAAVSWLRHRAVLRCDACGRVLEPAPGTAAWDEECTEFGCNDDPESSETDGSVTLRPRNLRIETDQVDQVRGD